MGELSQVVLVDRDGSWFFPGPYVIALGVCCSGVVLDPSMTTGCPVTADVDDVVEAPGASLRPLLAVMHSEPTPVAAALTQAT